MYFSSACGDVAKVEISVIILEPVNITATLNLYVYIINRLIHFYTILSVDIHEQFLINIFP